MALKIAAFGAEQLPASRRPAAMPSRPLEELKAVVTRVRRNAGDVVTVTLDNGQQWRQTGSYYFPIEDGNDLSVPVVIKPRLFSGYKLSPEGTARSISVERVR